jgi:hypothetical protein
VTAAVEGVAAPACPPWCTSHQPGASGWDETPRPNDIVKACIAASRAPGCGEVQLERWAALDGARIRVYAPEVRISVADALSLDDAEALAGQLLATGKSRAQSDV